MKRQPKPEPRPIVFPRSDPAELARFDPSTAVCTMNCGRHCDDPRTEAERRFQCDDCIKPANVNSTTP